MKGLARMAKKENTRSGFDDKSYWKARHARKDNLEASGLKSVGLRANHLIYKILEDQYTRLLNEKIQIDSVKTILDCGYGDGYFLRFFTEKFPNKSVEGVDISKEARAKITFFKNTDALHVGDLSEFNLKKKYDLVHCFDVLYHILKEEDYRNSLENIASHSQKYVILHEKFLKKSPLISARHVRFRRREVTNQILNSRGFYLHSEIPTHFFAMRLFTYRINRIFPSLLYGIDRKIADSFPDYLQESLASHSIRVYKKAD
jgi:hypothetical protein